MAAQSSTWLRLIATGSEIHFSAVTQLRHSLSLKVATDTDSSEATDYLNGARKQPAKLTLSLMETDAGHPKGWAARIAQNLEACRASQALLQVFTPIRTYNNMLLSDLVILQEEGSPDSWTGTATFTEADEAIAATAKPNDNSSSVTDTGAAPAKTVSSGASSGSGGDGRNSSSSEKKNYESPLKQLLQKAGITLEA